MNRLPVAAFVALVIATVGAFFVTQHLKVSTPLIAGYPAPVPNTINPVSGGVCSRRGPRGAVAPTSFRSTQVSFYLLNRADNVDVYVVNAAGTVIDTLPGSGGHMGIKRRKLFIWNGREDNGSVAPDGSYTLRVSLVHEGRSLTISNQDSGAVEPVVVDTHQPRIRVTSITGAGIPAGDPIVVPQNGTSALTIHYTGNDHVRPRVLIYRTDLPGPPRLVKSYAATSAGSISAWNGTLAGGAVTPQGTYLVGLQVTNKACTTGRFPAQLPPPAGSTAGAGVTVRYLAAQPPMVATPAGSAAAVEVDARRHTYHWKLFRAGAGPRVLRSGTTSSPSLSVPLPGGAPGLYQLVLSWGSYRTAVPLIAGAPAGSHPKVLVVLPALTWQGLNPVDDDGDGLPNTLTDGEPVRLARVLVNGLPAGWGDETGLVAALRRLGLPFDVTTDVALAEGTGPQITGHAGIVLAGSESWLPPALGSALSTYVEQGGHVLSLGIGSMLRGVTVTGGQALDPTPARSTDALLARPGPVTSSHGALILVSRDGLHIFSGTSEALRGYASYQPFQSVVAPASIASAAGVGNGQPAIVGYHLGRGIVVDIGLPGFGSSLATNFDARQLLGRVWTVLSR